MRASRDQVSTAPVRLTRRGWGVLGGAVGLWIAWWGIGLHDLWYLIALLVGLVLVSVVSVTVFGIRARPDLHVATASMTPSRGDTVLLSGVIRHRLPAACTLRVVWTAAGETRAIAPDGLRDAGGRGDSDAPGGYGSAGAMSDVGGTGVARSHVEWQATGRGRVTAGITGLQVSDPLGLAVRHLRTDAAVEILVLPRLLSGLSERVDELQPAAGAEDLTTRPVVLNDGGSPAGAVREYRSGDPRRQIHWKQSARQGELLVNLHETADAPERAVLLVTAGGAYPVESRAAVGTGAGNEQFELAVSATATLALRWIRQGYTVRLLLGGERAIRCTTEREALRELAFVRMSRTGGAGLWDPQHTAPPHIIVTGSITTALCEELARLGGRGLLLAHSRRPGTRIPPAWRTLALHPRGETAETGTAVGAAADAAAVTDA